MTAVLAVSAIAHAGILSTTGDVVQITPPASARFNDPPESDTEIFIFEEQRAYALPVAVAVNITSPGLYDEAGDLVSQQIPAGAVVDCHYLFMDAVDSHNITNAGSVTFDRNILAVICMDAELDASDPVLGRPGTLYHTGQSARGIEIGADTMTVSDDRRTLTIHQFHTTYPGESVRVITVPEPATLCMLAVGAVCFLRRKR